MSKPPEKKSGRTTDGHWSNTNSGNQAPSSANDMTVNPNDMTVNPSEMSFDSNDATIDPEVTADLPSAFDSEKTIDPPGGISSKNPKPDTFEATHEHTRKPRGIDSSSSKQSGSSSLSNEALFDDPRALGAFNLVKKLGSGAFGDVFRATDVQLDRDVAIKVVRADRTGDDNQREEFLEEARSVAQLKHKNIVPVHQVGELHTGNPFIVYEFIDGPTLRQRKKVQKRFLPHEAVELLVRIADGLGHAHSLGIFHRDVKPANILIEEKTGEPHIADFGCASRRNYRQNPKADGGRSYVGTLAYFSPEQAAGKSEEADARTDVWALGIIMDELLSGKRSLHELETMYGSSRNTLKDYLDKIQTYRPTPLRERASIDRDLNAIWMKCLAIDPDGRYANASFLADDLRRWQRSEPVKARPISFVARLVRWGKRNPQIAASLAAVFGTILAAAIVTFLFLQKSISDNKKMGESVVKQLVKTQSNGLRDAVRQLQEEEFEDAVSAALRKQWVALVAQYEDSEKFNQTKRRLSLGFVALDPKTGNDSLDVILDRAEFADMDNKNPYLAFNVLLNRDDVTADEFRAFREVLVGIEKRSENGEKSILWLKQLLLRVVQEDGAKAASKLKAACLLSYLDGDYKDKGTHFASREFRAEDYANCLFEMEEEDGSGTEWVSVVLDLIPNLPKYLRESPNTRVASELLVKALQRPEDLLQQIGENERPLAGLLPTLKERVNEQILEGEKTELSFNEFVSDSGIGTSNPVLTAKLWLAFLYCADLDRDLDEIDEWLLLENPASAIDLTDRTAETIFINNAFASGISRQALLQLCEYWHEKKDKRAAAILLALGNFPPEGVEGRDQLVGIWKSNPYAGAHAACEWLMRKWKFKFSAEDYAGLPTQYAKERNWRYDKVEVSLDSGKTIGGRMLFVKIKKPISPFRVDTKRNGLLEIPIRSDFEISAFETSVQQYLDFLEDNEFTKLVDSKSRRMRKTGFQVKQKEKSEPAPCCWFEAIEYCTWRSWKQNRQSCYGKLEAIAGAYSDKTGQLPACNRTMNGYRLPTSNEWEFACRAGSTTVWHAGTDPSHLRYYANAAENGGERQTCGKLRPNSWGLFDTLGNVQEWTDSYKTEAMDKGYYEKDNDIRPKVRIKVEKQVDFLTLRGGHFRDYRSDLNSAAQRQALGRFDDDGVGFRIARSLNETAD